MKDPVILITVDVEDWFQVENFKQCIPLSSWPSCELRVEKNTHRILDLLDEASLERSAISGQRSAVSGRLFSVDNKSSEFCKSCLNGASENYNGQRTTDHGQHEKVRGTFFVLGWLAERLPNLVREIQARGHEVASHGYGHELCNQCSSEDLKEDLIKSKNLLEDIIGALVHGYRAPSFSISDDILKMISEAGYLYDSSYNSFSMHGRYGSISLNGHQRRGIGILLNQKSTIENRKFYELPVSNLPLLPSRTLDTLGILAHFRHSFLPWGGGGYFRLIPKWIFKKGIRKILSDREGYLFYMHPWEIDPDQPRVKQAARGFRFRHYVNLGRTEQKLKDLFRHFSDCRFINCSEYLKEVS